MPRILITGGAGFIGTHLAERLLSGGSTVTLLDNFRRDSLRYAPALRANPNLKVVSGSVESSDTVKEAISDADTVVHLAAIAGVSSYYSEPLQTLQTNILGTVNILEHCANAKIRKLIYFLTSEIYGSNALWVTETCSSGIGSVSDLRWVYATSKLSGENFSLRYSEKYGFSCTVIRSFNIYGPRQIGEGAISNFCRAIAERKPLVIHGDGSAIRAWCYIDDLIDAIVLDLNQNVAGQFVFNIGNPKEIETTYGLARRMLSIAPESSYEFKPGPASEVRIRIPRIEKATEVLGFTPKISLEEGLICTLKWFRENG